MDGLWLCAELSWVDYESLNMELIILFRVTFSITTQLCVSVHIHIFIYVITRSSRQTYNFFLWAITISILNYVVTWCRVLVPEINIWSVLVSRLAFYCDKWSRVFTNEMEIEKRSDETIDVNAQLIVLVRTFGDIRNTAKESNADLIVPFEVWACLYPCPDTSQEKVVDGI